MKRLLYIAHRVPYPPDKGERVRAFHEITALAGLFDVTVAALAHNRADVEAATGLSAWCERVVVARAGGKLGLLRGGAGLLAGRSATEGYFRSRRMSRAIHGLAAHEPFDLVVVASSGALPYALAVPARARIADLVDVDSAKWSAYARSARWPMSWVYRREAEGVRRLERLALRQCNAVALTSAAEVDALDAEGATALAVGNGVDLDYFAPAGEEPAGSPSLVFTGTMDYRPNVEGVCWFAETVWPALRRDVPDLRFVVVGRNPTQAVLRLARSPGIEVTGAVPDVRPYVARATLAVAPLLMARGIQNKVLEAMAMGRAVVASPAAIEGLDVQPGEDLVEARDGDGWQREVLALLRDEARRRRVELAARARVETKYTWQAQLEPLLDLCRRLAGPQGAATDGEGERADRVPAAAHDTMARPEADGQ